MTWKKVWLSNRVRVVLVDAAVVVVVICAIQLSITSSERDGAFFKNCWGEFYTGQCLKDKAARELRELNTTNAENYHKYKEQH